MRISTYFPLAPSHFPSLLCTRLEHVFLTVSLHRTESKALSKALRRSFFKSKPLLFLLKYCFASLQWPLIRNGMYFPRSYQTYAEEVFPCALPLFHS